MVDRIATEPTEIQQLENELEKRHCIIVQLEDQIERLEDHNGRLKAALEASLPTIKRPSHDHPTCDCHPCKRMRLARAALEG
jgi:DNA invertase Pin-like site-specific DNA recombinase